MLNKIKEFKKFAFRGNVIDLAIGVVIGSAFTSVIKSFVSDMIMPSIGLVLGNVDFADLFIVMKEGIPPEPYRTLADAQAAGAVTLNYGIFADKIVLFIIVAYTLFLVVQYINQLRRDEYVSTTDSVVKECPYCHSSIHIKASRCPHCTSEIDK